MRSALTLIWYHTSRDEVGEEEKVLVYLFYYICVI